VLLSLASNADAAWHIYVVPTVTSADGIDPKYVTDAHLFSCLLYGHQSVNICAADTDTTLDAIINGASDAYSLPDNLDANISAGAVDLLKTALENRNIPAQWVDSLHTYRQALRIIHGMFSLLGRYIAVSKSHSVVFGGSVTLNTTMAQLPTAARNNLRTSATQLGCDITAITNSTTLRSALQIVGEQFLSRPFVLGGIKI
jgi:hypothetical protein